MKEILIVVDMQNDFVTGALGSKEAVSILPKVRTKIEQARAAGKEVVFTRDTHGEDYLSTQEGRKLPVAHCLQDTCGWEIVDGLCKAGDKIFDKPTFGSVSLSRYLKDNNFDRIELIGVCTDICVVSNALLIKAFCPETEVVVDGGCCAGVTKEKHLAALETMRSCQVTVS